VDFAAARANMVDCQLRTNKVRDPRVLHAFETLPRELFVPEARRGIAYVDKDLEIAPDRHLMEPMVLARLIQEAAVEPDDLVLAIGGASGYSSAILSQLAATVVALESDPGLAARAGEIRAELGIDNVVAEDGPLDAGYPSQAPYNAILIDGAVPEVPAAIADQLADGGRLVTVVREAAAPGRAVLMRRTGEVVSGRILFDAATPLLPGFARAEEFVF
jgi:protein-L-isoaspartate(D-aspartate) O-methyltransferase